MIARLTVMAAAACLLWQWDNQRRQRHQREPLARNVRTKPEEVTTWEGEGGALPVTGAQQGPAPAQP